MKKEITKEQLEELYIKQNLSIKAIKAITGICTRPLGELIKKYGLQKTREQIKKQTQEFNMKKYGFSHPSKSPLVKEKQKQTDLEKYGTPHHILAKTVKEKSKKTNLERYGVENYLQSQEGRNKVQQTSLEKYGTLTPLMNSTIREKAKESLNKPEAKIKRNNSRKMNGTTNSSSTEEQAYQLLLTKFDKEDIIRQYNDIRYSNENNRCFDCDFYIKSLDLFIEFNGSHYHYKEPYDKNNKEHQKRLEKLLAKDPQSGEQAYHMIKVWTKSDPEKRRVAKENNLNWKEFFTIAEVRKFINS